MTQRTSPFLEIKYGWEYGESGWNSGMDENLLKFSFLFHKNIDGIVETLPSISTSEGKAFYLTVDRRVYFAVGGVWSSSPLPIWFVVNDKATGQSYLFDGVSLVPQDAVSTLRDDVDAINQEINLLGSAAYKDESYFATSSSLDVASAQANSYTDALRADLTSASGAELVGFSLSGVSGAILRTINDRSSESVSVKDFGAVGDGIANDTAAINAALDSVPLLKTGRIFVPAGTYRVRRTTAVGDYNTALLIKHSNTQLILDPRAVIMLDDGQDCAVIRTAMAGLDAGFSGRLSNVSIVGGGVIDGNWGQQTWAGPDGSAGGTVTVYDQDGIMMNAVDGVQLDVNVRNCAQDGITIASSTKIDVWGGSVKDCGKGGLTFFLCESFTVHGGDFENPNSSPDEGVTKPFYTISSEGYAALGAAYKPDAAFSTERNKGAFVAPRIKCRKGAGRGISVINTFGLDIVAPDIEMWGNKQGITVGCQNAGVPSNTDAIAIIGGQIHRLSQTADARVISLTSDKANTLYVRNVSVSGLKVRSFGAYTSSVVATDVTGSLSITDLRVEHGGATTSGTLDIRGCEDVGVVGGSLTGTVTFGSGGTTALARVVGTKLGSAMIGISAVTKLLGSSNSGDSSTSPVGDVLRVGASIGAATTEETAITINGAVVGDAVLVSHTNPTNIAAIDVRADVTGANTVTLRLRNNTTAAVTVGSGTFYFRILKR